MVGWRVMVDDVGCCGGISQMDAWVEIDRWVMVSTAAVVTPASHGK